MSDASDEESQRAEGHVRGIELVTDGAGQQRTALTSQLPHIRTVLPSGPKIEVVETDDCRREKAEIIKRLSRRF